VDKGFGGERKGGDEAGRDLRGRCFYIGKGDMKALVVAVVTLIQCERNFDMALFFFLVRKARRYDIKTKATRYVRCVWKSRWHLHMLLAASIYTECRI